MDHYAFLKANPLASIVTSIIAPLCGIVLVGFLAGYFRLLSSDGSAHLSRFVFNIALPALVFEKLRNIPVVEFFDWQFIGALGGGMLAVMLLSFTVARIVFSHDLTAMALHGLTAMFSSTAYIGLPLILIVFGDTALAPGIIGAVITGIVFMPIAIFIAEFDRGKGQGRLSFRPLSAALTKPVIIATALGLVFSGLELDAPKAVVQICELLGKAFVPCALFAAGLFVSDGVSRMFSAEIGWLLLAKLVLHPLITWVLAFHVFQLEGPLPVIAVLQAALPAGVPVFVMAQQYAVFEQRSNTVIVLSTAISMVTLPVLLLVLGV